MMMEGKAASLILQRSAYIDRNNMLHSTVIAGNQCVRSKKKGKECWVAQVGMV